jgi:hypothetical protein
VFRGATGRPKTTLDEREFVEVYIALSRATTPQAKAQVLKQHGTSEQELEEFIKSYLNDLPALSSVFDSIVARQGAQQSGVPVLPR